MTVKKFSIVLSCSLFPLSLLASNSKHPNVVFILADDLGYGDISYNGQRKYNTPNIDSLFSTGVVFDQHYSGSSVSAPSRASLLTGLHTGHTVIRGNLEMEGEGQWPLPEESYTLFDLFKSQGYVTGVFGKWGLGAPGTEGDPMNQNVDRFFGYNCQRQAHNYYPYYLWDDSEKLYLKGNVDSLECDYSPYLIHKEAIDFINDNQNTPFFLFYSTTLPHAELKIPEKEMAKFVGTPDMDPEKPYSGRDYGDEGYKNSKYGSQNNPHSAFASMVSLLDRQVGDIMRILDSLNIADNTILVFTSDNGPHKEGGADPVFFNSNASMRGFKRDLYEGGIHVPMAIRWPAEIGSSAVSGHISAFWDFLPTFADILDVTVPTETDGISFKNELMKTGKQKEHDYLYWEFYESGGRQAIRKGNWKAVRYNVRKHNPIKLFDLSSDPGEENDLSELYPDIIDELDSLMKTAHTESTLFKF